MTLSTSRGRARGAFLAPWERSWVPGSPCIAKIVAKQQKRKRKTWNYGASILRGPSLLIFWQIEEAATFLLSYSVGNWSDENIVFLIVFPHTSWNANSASYTRYPPNSATLLRVIHSCWCRAMRSVCVWQSERGPVLFSTLCKAQMVCS